MVANHNCFRLRGALREVAKVHGRPNGEIREVTRRIPWFSDDDSLEATLAHHPNFAALDLPGAGRTLAREAQPLVGVPRHLSLHPGGVVIVPTALTDYVPTQPAVKVLDGAPDVTVPVIQFEKDGAEDAGLVKIDLLGNRSLAVIRDAIAMVREHTGVQLDYSLLRRGRRPEDEGAVPHRADAWRLLYRVARVTAALYQEPRGQLRPAGAQHQHHPSGLQPLHPRSTSSGCTARRTSRSTRASATRSARRSG